MAEILFLADNPTCVWAEYKTPNGHAYNRYMMLAQAALAASNAPAVTVTEEMVEAFLNRWFPEGWDDFAAEYKADCRPALEVALQAALKSTTPQTGSQE